MSKNSDNNDKPRTNIFELLPEVYRSELNETLFETSFNRHVTKDDTVRISGFIGQGNPAALVDRQIQEPTPFRQAFQLQPTMYTRVGSTDHLLTQQGFLTQLELIGVDINRLPQWGNTLQFNWVPPINIDMLVNYFDYYWSTNNPTDPPQYFTIENRCNKARTKAYAYENVIERVGELQSLLGMDVTQNQFVIEGDLSTLFVAGFVFFTKNTLDVNLINKFWTAASSTYDVTTNETTITTQENIPIVSVSTDPDPVTTEVGRLWYAPDTTVLKRWNGVLWVVIAPGSVSASGDISLTELLTIFQRDANCVCDQDFGWDLGLWDDNQLGPLLWNTALLAAISHPTEAAWIVANGIPSDLDLWYDTTSDQLKQYFGVTAGYQNVVVFLATLGTFVTALPADTYDFDVTIDGGPLQQLSITTVGGETYTAIAALMSAVIVGGSVAYSDTLSAFVITSSTSGVTSTMLVTAGTFGSTGGDLFAALTVFDFPKTFTFNTPVVGTSPNTVVINGFSSILVLTTGRTRWDFTDGCVAQELNQWSEQNKWIHKTEVQSFGNVKHAKIPIIEYNSTIELNEWTHSTYQWKYRPLVSDTFEDIGQSPWRFELEPVKGYAAALISGKWFVYLFERDNATLNRDINHTAAFTPGKTFRITDDGALSQVYTVVSSEYRKIAAADPVNTVLFAATLQALTDYYVTVVEIVEPVFTAPTVGGGVFNARVEPTTTSRGDVWRGYHVHWLLDPNSTTVAATTSQTINPELALSLEESAVGINPTYSVTFTLDPTLGAGLLEVGRALVIFTPNIAGVTKISLRIEEGVDYDSVPPSATLPITDGFDLQYVPTESRFYATPDSCEVRVYINDIRQYGTYTENIAFGLPNYTAIGFNTTTNPLLQIPYVESITFFEPLAAFDVVRIEVCPATFNDMGMFAVPVRTVENEAAFAAAVIAGTQPEYRSLTQYCRVEQVKREVNQYPLFNVYDVCEATVINASPLFAYKEDADCPINPNVRRRIFATTDGRDYTFIQYLLDRDDNLLYGYRNLDLAPVSGTFWYSPHIRQAYQWDGTTWASVIFVNTAIGLAARSFIVSDTEPTDLLTVDGALWMDSLNEKLYQRDIIGVQWVELTNIIIEGADPTLETVWKNGNNHEYVPQYVDADRQPVTVGDPSGDWELLDQWFYNSEHKNKAESKYTQLVTHFRDIVIQQPDVPGFAQGGVYTLTQNEFDYGLGGIMKEHNDSFDTLISAVNVTNVTPLGLMEWAEDQYTLGFLTARDLFNKDITSLYGVFTPASLVNQTQGFIDNVILQYKLNDFLATVYGDTTAFNDTTDIGMPNWIATAPILRLSEKFRPHLLVTDDFVDLFHHDGHRSRISYTGGEQDRYSRQIIALPDDRVPSGTLGLLSSVAPPVTEGSFIALFGGVEMRSGVYWYRVGGGFRTLYRFVAYAVVPLAPSFFLDGDELPDGTRYYNTATNLTYIKSGLFWVVDTAIPFDISTMWQEVNFALDFATIALDIETKLYEAVPDTDLVFDYSTLTPNASEQAEYDRQYEKRFYAFVAERSIQAPLVNTTYSATNAFTWNYVNSLMLLPPRTDITPANAAAWQEMYTRWYNTPYPHLEPWKLQGFHDKPTWWDGEYLETSGARRWIYNHGTTTGMWENIRVGRIPVTGFAPDGTPGTGLAGQVVITYNYFSVNIDDVPVGGFDPDEVFPPYLSSLTVGFAPSVRSLFSNLGAEIFAPDSDYLFGDGGPTEWLWTVSSEFVYDIPIIAFLMQPARFLHSSFGVNFIDVDRLQVETLFCQVYSHEDALFHSDIYNTDQIYSANGLNQWYVNFNRSSGYDTSNEFRYLWAGWNPQMSYQFAGIADTSTFNISSKYFDVSAEDYNIILANTGVFKDLWAEGFEVSILNIPPAIIQYNNEVQWKFNLDSLATVDRELNYYGVRLYPYTIDTTADDGTLFNYTIVDASSSGQRFYVSGNQIDVFLNDLEFTVSGSTGNDGTYTTSSSVFEPGANRTRINVVEPVLSSVGDGQLDVAGFVSPWVTGQQVVVSSSRNLPAPLVNGAPYFIINTGARTFQLAETVNDALALIPIDFTTPGDGELRIGEIAASFQVYGGSGNSSEIWYHYAIDKNILVTVAPPLTVQGMQALVNVFDGYADYQRDQGELFNLTTTSDFDLETGRAVDWQFELERFINWAYGLRRSRLQVADRFQFAVNPIFATQELNFTPTSPVWQSGTPIVFSTTGSLPAPLLAGVVYYFVQTTTPGVFKVSISSNTNLTANYITFTTMGSGTMYVAQHRAQLVFPSLEVNPIRNNIWFDTPQGIMANIVTGPFADIRVSQTIFDQHGRQLTPDQLNVYRLDKQTHIAVRPLINDDLSMIPAQFRTDHDFLHMGGGHFFMEGYEHVLLFNDYSVGGAVIYDQFYGLYTQKFNLDYFEKENYTLRPTIGGFYLIDGQFQRNVEGATVDLHNYYDTYGLREGTLQARHARHLLGYNGTENFLDLINLGNKSQFLFYQGMIQYKGSVAGAHAYINSRRFVDAKIDEFWAWKIAEYGDPRLRVYPQIKLFSTDATHQDVRMHFLGITETIDDTDVQVAIEDEFNIVDFNIGDRWEIYPEQKSEIVNPLFLDAEVSSMYRVYVSDTAPTAGQNTIDYLYRPTTNEFRTWNGGTTGTLTDWDVVTTAPLEINDDNIPGTTYVKLDRIYDEARVLRRTLSTPGDLREYETVIYNQGGGLEEFEKINSEVIKFQTAGFGDVMIFFTINPGFSKISPSKLIDKKANTVVDEVQLWDPARNHHSTVAIHNVDLQNPLDPAGYGVTRNPADAADFVWGTQQVGTVWLDTTVLGYKSYYDDKLYPDVNDRLNLWGTLADWGSAKVYEWTGSSVPPSEYASIVTDQADALVPQRSKASGEARQTLFRRTRVATPATIVGITSGSQIANFGGTVVGGNPTGLAAGTQGYQDINLTTSFVAGDDPRGAEFAGAGPFQAHIFVDGDSFLINVTAVSVPTYTALLAQINAQLLGAAVATIFDTDTIRITSASVGLGSTVTILDINLFGNLADAPTIIGLPVSGTSTTYTATLALDGINYGISVLGDDAQTFTALINAINPQISGFGAIAISGGNLVVTSTSVGTTSTVAITVGTLFPALTGFVGLLVSVDGTYGQVKVPTGTFAVDTTVLFTSTDTLPAGLETSTNYLIAAITTVGPDDLLDLEDADGNPILISTFGSPTTFSAVPAFSQDWARVPFIRERQRGAIDFTPPDVSPTINLTPSVGWVAEDKVHVYINDTLVVNDYVLTSLLEVVLTDITVQEKDIIDIVRPVRTLTEEETNFDPDTEDDGTVFIQWDYDYEYSTFTTFSGSITTIATPTYYFWVENSQFRDITDQAGISPLEVAQQLVDIPTPHFVVQLPKDDPALQALYGFGLIPYDSVWSLAALSEQLFIIPVLYRQAILRKASSNIAQDNRFVWKFTRDLALRNSLKGNLNLKNKHAEWFMFRREQPSSIPRELWDRLTEALIGYTLADPTVRVPTLDRELYDALFGTDTRFGLGVDQAFCDKNYALATIVAYLTNPDIDFQPTDIDTFFATYSFDTPANTAIAMDAIYESFGSEHVNNIWFETLSDALATRAKYKELFKTSWVALHGIRVLEVGGLFDD